MSVRNVHLWSGAHKGNRFGTLCGLVMGSRAVTERYNTATCAKCREIKRGAGK